MSNGDPKQLIPEECTSGYSYTYLPQIGTYKLALDDGECYRINTVTGETHRKYGGSWELIKEPTNN